MFWVKRRFEYADYAPYMDRLEKLMMANAADYQQFIMVSTKTDKPGVSEFYIGVPRKELLQVFDGFTPVEEASLPREIDTLHLADATKEPFQSRFRFRGRK